ncbi:MAG: hypothetical protein R6U69_06435 [Marinobacter sp.]|uniref:hypothetical protein n=1 Tax=Marinobacter sp. TaxID=50741 RepID=UPI003566793D
MLRFVFLKTPLDGLSPFRELWIDASSLEVSMSPPFARNSGTVKNLKDRRHDLYTVNWRGQ